MKTIMKLEQLFEIGKKISEGESVSLFKVTQLNEKTIEFEVLKENLNKEYKDCGIITSDPKYWYLTPKTRRRKLSDEVYISLMKFSEKMA
jgi:hypothetical protein